MGYANILDRFNRDATYRDRMLKNGRNKQQMRQWDFQMQLGPKAAALVHGPGVPSRKDRIERGWDKTLHVKSNQTGTSSAYYGTCNKKDAWNAKALGTDLHPANSLMGNCGNCGKQLESFWVDPVHHSAGPCARCDFVIKPGATCGICFECNIADTKSYREGKWWYCRLCTMRVVEQDQRKTSVPWIQHQKKYQEPPIPVVLEPAVPSSSSWDENPWNPYRQQSNDEDIRIGRLQIGILRSGNLPLGTKSGK